MKTLDSAELTAVCGGLQWEKFGQSTNVEDRRSPAAKRRDDRWWTSQHPTAPLPPRRPEGL